MIDKLLIYILTGLDLRRMDKQNTPYLHGLFQRFPWVKINTLPDSDLLPTFFTGMYPHEHGIWQLRLKPQNSFDTNKLYDNLPDLILTTSQCFIHMLTGNFDLAAVPDWRRRRFEIVKTKYMKKELKEYFLFNGHETFLHRIGETKCNYVHNEILDKIDQSLLKIFKKNALLEIIEEHSIDSLQHWYLDDIKIISGFYNKIDNVIKNLHSQCQKNGATLLIISDHGQEAVRGSIDIIGEISKLGIKKEAFTYYIEPPKARFWFHSSNAKEKILTYLSSIEIGEILNFRDLHKYNIKFENDRYGEFYFLLNPGYVFFPHDFYHPIANMYLGITNKQQRSRLKSPVYRGYHGYLPHNESEKGFVILTDDRYNTDKKEIETIDFAPTVLYLLGYEQPAHLKGVSAFYG